MPDQIRDGGRVGASAAFSGFFAVPVGIIRRPAALPAPLPGHPGPVSLGALHQMLTGLSGAKRDDAWAKT